MAENLEKSDAQKIAELYRDWKNPDDPERAFRGRFIIVEKWYLDKREEKALKDAENKGKRFLVEKTVQLLRYIGFSGLLLLIGFAIRFYNSWQGGTP